MLKTKLTFFIVIVVFFVLLFVTNPTMDKYEQFVHQQIIQETTKQDGMSRILGTLFGGVASNLISNATLRHDYLLLSVFEAQLGNDHLKVIGILNHFIVLNAPTFKAANNNDLSATSKNEPVSSKPIYQEEKIPRKEVKKDIIQRDFKAGPITVSTYGKCSPIMNDCESYAVLNSGNQSLKINSVGSPF